MLHTYKMPWHPGKNAACPKEPNCCNQLIMDLGGGGDRGSRKNKEKARERGTTQSSQSVSRPGLGCFPSTLAQQPARRFARSFRIGKLWSCCCISHSPPPPPHNFKNPFVRDYSRFNFQRKYSLRASRSSGLIGTDVSILKLSTSSKFQGLIKSNFGVK